MITLLNSGVAANAILWVAMLALFFPRIVLGDDAAKAANATSLSRTLQDPETKVVYYLESDMSHLAAISPEGTLLWARETASTKQGEMVVGFAFGASPRNHNEGCIVLRIKCPGKDDELVWVRRKDGAIAAGESVDGIVE